MQTHPIRFSCHGCGHCCRQMGTYLALAAAQPEPLRAELLAFPHGITPTGACDQLLPNGGCASYETRPLICRVDELYDAYFTTAMPRADWHALNASQCPPKSPED